MALRASGAQRLFALAALALFQGVRRPAVGRLARLGPFQPSPCIVPAGSLAYVSRDPRQLSASFRVTFLGEAFSFRALGSWFQV